MNYWDASALVPLFHQETGSDLVRQWLQEDPVVATWALTRLEVASAVERAARQGVLSFDERRRALAWLDRLAEGWTEVMDLGAVRRRALGLIARHAVKAADAAQLASALLMAESAPSSFAMVCLDRRLAEAADREGIRIRTWPS